MAAHGSHRETEIKLSVAGAAQARRLLARAGFRVSRRRIFEANTLFDTESRKLRASDCLLRLRRAGRRHVLTFKGPSTRGKHKSREELELELTHSAPLEQILSRLGFGPVFRYEKYRTEYSEAGRPGLVTLDETPIGDFLELEGPPEWIDRTARRLGFTGRDYITETYAGLYLAFCRRMGRKPADMVFPQGAGGSSRARGEDSNAKGGVPDQPEPADRRPGSRRLRKA